MKKLLFILASIVCTTIAYGQEVHDPMLLEVSVNGESYKFNEGEWIENTNSIKFSHINWPYRKSQKVDGEKFFKLYERHIDPINICLNSFEVTILDAVGDITTNFLFSKGGMFPWSDVTENKNIGKFYHVGNWSNSTAVANGWKENDFLTVNNDGVWHFNKVNLFTIGVAADGTCIVYFNCEGSVPVDIETIQTNEKEVEAYFTVNGVKLPNKPTQNGLYIVKYKNSTTQKKLLMNNRNEKINLEK